MADDGADEETGADGEVTVFASGPLIAKVVVCMRRGRLAQASASSFSRRLARLMYATC